AVQVLVGPLHAAELELRVHGAAHDELLILGLADRVEPVRVASLLLRRARRGGARGAELVDALREEGAAAAPTAVAAVSTVPAAGPRGRIRRVDRDPGVRGVVGR